MVGRKLKKSDRSSAVGHVRFVWVCSVVSFVFVSVNLRTIDISSLIWNIIIYFNHGVTYGHRNYCMVIRKWQSVRPVRRQGRTVTYLPAWWLRSLPYVYACFNVTDVQKFVSSRRLELICICSCLKSVRLASASCERYFYYNMVLVFYHSNIMFPC